MRLRLVPTSGVPIYRQIVDQVGDQIACGQLRLNDRLPSVRDLARMLPANQNTVLKAYELLEHAGLITRRHGEGTFVSGRSVNLPAAERREALSDLLAQAARKAVLFGVSPAELRKMLDAQVTRVTQEGVSDESAKSDR